MAFDKSEVEKIAHLARLHISDLEADEVTARIGDILHLIDQMQSVDTDAVEPLAHPLDVAPLSARFNPVVCNTKHCRSLFLRASHREFPNDRKNRRRIVRCSCIR